SLAPGAAACETILADIEARFAERIGGFGEAGEGIPSTRRSEPSVGGGRPPAGRGLICRAGRGAGRPSPPAVGGDSPRAWLGAAMDRGRHLSDRDGVLSRQLRGLRYRLHHRIRPPGRLLVANSR